MLTVLRSLLVASLVSATATASPITGMIGPGVALVDDSTGNHPVVLSVDGLVAYRLGAHWAIGLRSSVTTADNYTELRSVGGGGDHDQRDWSIHAFDIGPTVQFSTGALWIAPWFGQHCSFGDYKEVGQRLGTPLSNSDTFSHRDFFELGLTAGYDVYADDIIHVTVYADYHHGFGQEPYPPGPYIPDSTVHNWSALTFGVAFRR